MKQSTQYIMYSPFITVHVFVIIVFQLIVLLNVPKRICDGEECVVNQYFHLFH